MTKHYYKMLVITKGQALACPFVLTIVRASTLGLIYGPSRGRYQETETVTLSSNQAVLCCVV